MFNAQLPIGLTMPQRLVLIGFAPYVHVGAMDLRLKRQAGLSIMLFVHYVNKKIFQ